MTGAQRDALRRDMHRLLDRGARVDRDGGDTLDDKLLKLHAALLTHGKPKPATKTGTRKPVSTRAKTPPPAPHNPWPAGYRVWPPPGQRAAIDPETYRD